MSISSNSFGLVQTDQIEGYIATAAAYVGSVGGSYQLLVGSPYFQENAQVWRIRMYNQGSASMPLSGYVYFKFELEP